MSPARVTVVCALALMILAIPARAWDEVTHGHLTDMAMGYVHTPGLRDFLSAHRDELQSGAWFPDWGHAIKPHGDVLHAAYLDAAFAYLQRPEVRAAGEYDRLLAHYLGACAHVVEDRVLDSTFKKHARDAGEPRRDDMENGMLGIAGEHYLRQTFTYYVPAQDLARIYALNEYFGEPRLNANSLDSLMRANMHQAMIKHRQLKLLSFLTAGYARRQFPWGATHLVTAPGGFESNARAVAATWEALWAELHGHDAPFFVYSIPENKGVLPSADRLMAYGRVTVVTRHRFDVRQLSPSDVRLESKQSGRVPVTVFPYIDEPGHDIDLAFQIEAGAPWRLGAIYTLSITPSADSPGPLGSAQPFAVEFTIPEQPLWTNRIEHAPRPWAMGLFLFAFVGSIAGMLFGVADVLRIVLPVNESSRWLAGLRILARAAGVALGGFALFLLWTDGAPLIEFLRQHH